MTLFSLVMVMQLLGIAIYYHLFMEVKYALLSVIIAKQLKNTNCNLATVYFHIIKQPYSLILSC